MNFEFMTANRIIFETGGIAKIGKLAKEFGNRVLLSSGMSMDETKKVMGYLQKEGITPVVLMVQGEPSVEGLKEGLELARKEMCDSVIGFGGGSAMDTGKVIAAMLKNPGEIIEYLEVIGAGRKLKMPSAPCIEIPTTSGTGAEVTKNAVLSSIENKVKVSLRSQFMLPEIVLLDPELTISVPPDVTASTGLDALIQVLEPFVSKFANPITDAFCREGLRRAARSLKKAYDDGTDMNAREDMAITSLFGGLALANAKLGVVHGFAGVIGGMVTIPHGVICATLLPYAIKINVKSITVRDPHSAALKRYDEVAQILTGNQKATAMDGVLWIHELCKYLKVPTLSSFGLTVSEFPMIIEKSVASSSMKGNPIELTYWELEEILVKAL
ncbi:iron-containing alcohol dehydrogenase [Acetobacterium bakii]|uniref:Alcohol dehydrogenase n=1 Tax=Acetobacterium bakii TaxID=52689 RepID=A0A0L6TZD4_9FIRM|nr:iron-containing alcohol dehydrogenase [Acetobacterium bakii]KNZ41634.1 alcohol dehydrogenase [Acetobacterium bakii]